ncbi:MAG: hypothetical protein Q9N32_05685 [Gammaproteobacteria bacterium]|nr:hypothetical protein [Gammaproteobacteria bacterium]
MYCNCSAASNSADDDMIQANIDVVNQGLPSYARIMKWVRVSSDMTLDNELITSNGRPIRKNIYQQYQTSIEHLYKGN